MHQRVKLNIWSAPFHKNEPEILFDSCFFADEAQTATVAQFVKSRLASLHDSKTAPRFEGDASLSAPISATQDTKKNEVEATYANENTDMPTEEVYATA